MQIEKDFCGQTIGGMYVDSMVEVDENENPSYLCICDKCRGENIIKQEVLYNNDRNNTECKCQFCKNSLEESYIGQVINGRKIISIIKDHDLTTTSTIYETECIQCGNIKNTTITRLKNLKIICPECRQQKLIQQHIGEQHGSLTVIYFDHKDKKGNLFYGCRCICGEIVIKRIDVLIQKKGLSCGCQNLYSGKYIKGDIMQKPLVNPIQKVIDHRAKYLENLKTQLGL